MIADTLLNYPLVQAIGWTLVHFLWQGTAVALLLAAVNAALRRKSANARYFASCAALLLMLALPLITLWVIGKRSPVSISQNADTKLATTIEVLPVKPIQDESTVRLQGSIPAVELKSEPLTPVSNQSAQPRSWGFLTDTKLSSWLPWITSLWFAGVVLLSLRMFGGWLYTWRLLSRRTIPLGEVWQQRLKHLCEELRVSRPVRLVESALVQVPTAIGWLRPMILIPASALTGLTPRQFEAIIAHELAHIRRYDYLVNLIQTAVEILLFYHPAVWWVSRQARIEREHCCDDVAVEACGDVLTYARALSEIEELRNTTPRLVMAANGGVLLARIQRLLGAAPRSPYEPAPWMGALMAFALVFILAAGSRADLFSTITQTVDLADENVAIANAKALGNDPASVSIGSPELKPSEQLKATLQTQQPDEPASEENEPLSLEIEAVVIEAEPVQSQDGNYIEELSALGYTGLTVDQLIDLKNHGVTPAFIREMQAAGYTGLKVEELIRLASHGITAKYATAIKGAGIAALSLEDLVKMASHGVSPELVKGLREAGFTEITSDQVIRAASHAVTLEYVKEMRAAGYTDASLDEVIRARDHAVTVVFIKEMREKGLDNLKLDQVIRTRDNGVGPDYVKELRSLGFANVQVDEIIRAANNALSIEFIREMRNLGYTEASLNQLIRLRNNAVTPEFVKALKQAGYDRLDVDQVVRLRNNAVTPDYIKGLKQEGYDQLSVEDIVRMRNHAVTIEFIKKAKSQGVKNLSVDQLIRLRNAGIFN